MIRMWPGTLLKMVASIRLYQFARHHLQGLCHSPQARNMGMPQRPGLLPMAQHTIMGMGRSISSVLPPWFYLKIALRLFIPPMALHQLHPVGQPLSRMPYKGTFDLQLSISILFGVFKAAICKDSDNGCMGDLLYGLISATGSDRASRHLVCTGCSLFIDEVIHKVRSLRVRLVLNVYCSWRRVLDPHARR